MPTVMMSALASEVVNHYEIDSMWNGYFLGHKFVDLTEQTESLSFKGEQSHGMKRIIYASGSADDIPQFGNGYKDGTQMRGMTATEIETYLDNGLSTFGADVGTFYPEQGTDVLVNVDGLHIVKSSPEGYSISMYDADFTNLMTRIEIDTTTGNVAVSGTTAQQITLQIGTNTQLIITDGDVTVLTDQMNFNITDLHVSGTLTVEGITTLNDATTINSTLNTTGRAQLEGTNIVSS